MLLLGAGNPTRIVRRWLGAGSSPAMGVLVARLLGPVLLVLLAASIAASWSLIGATLGLAPDAPAARWGRMIAEAAVWLAAAWGLLRVLDIALWHGVLERRSGVPVPRLLSDLVAGLVWVVALMMVLAQVFALPVAALATTSGVAIAIIGFALRDMIASLFSGIAINLERPYQIGDWIEVEPGVVSKVLEVGWLTTRTVTRDGIGVVVPNARLATAPFRNYNQPQPAWRDSVAITLDYTLPGERVERILLAAMTAVPAVAAQRNRPDVKIEAFIEVGIRWQARYWVSDYDAMPETRYAVQQSILRQLHYAGIAVPYPKRDLFLARMPERALDHRRHLDAILARNELFTDLAPEELRELAQRARERFCPADMPVVRTGDQGASLFMVVEGLLRVLRPSVDGDEREVDAMTPGDAFGEFSLLTGEPRRATIVPQGDAVLYEITKEDLEPILRRRQDLAERLSEILARRQLHGQQEERILGRRAEPRAARPSPQVWRDRVRAFFGLGQNDRSA
jgi:small-conductance mechanosensitive channel/CRP-like cAMP-binding protein